MSKIRFFLIFGVIILAGVQQVFAQINYPNDTHNTRFFTDYYSNHIVRPALSLRGFDSQKHWQNTAAVNYGYGLKQIIDNYNNNEIQPLLEEIKKGAQLNTTIPTGSISDKVKIINANAVIIESKAFMALLGYVLEINGLSYTSVGISSIYSARQYLDQLTIEFMNPKGNLLTGIELVDALFGDTILSGDVEPIHTLNSTMSITRALDLYLAIENAYKYYADQNAENDDYYYCDMTGKPACSTSWPLFTKTEKTNTLNRVANAASIFYDLSKSDLQDVGNELVGPAITAAVFSVFPTYASIITIITNNIDIEETQPGNWSYKQYLGAGYTALGMQTGTGLTHTNDFNVWFNKAFKTTFKVAGTDRTAYFGYQTDDGKEYWAEGQLYFRITLRELIPFIHAVRGNQFWKNYDPSTGVLSNGIYERSDPFFSTWFTNSLNWLAETATPDGRTAPIDDSKKQRLAESSVLRWSSSYGDGTIGNKFAAVNNSLSLSTATTSEPNSIFEDEISVSTSYGQSTASYGSVVGLRIVELAIPRNSGAGTDFYSVYSSFNDYTNPSGSSMTSTSKQSTVIRRQINGKKHFILMNGEYGDAIGRGEGHEQPDQLQLLYYIDDQSYLMDAGYDNGTISANSSWNHIKYHNLPAYKPNADQTSGGESPPINGWGIDHSVKHSTWDKVARKVAKQDNVVKNYSEKHGNITLLKGEKRLGYFDWQDLHYIEHRLKHFRDVLFIEDPNFPYLIDINTTYRIKEDYDLYEMNYYLKGSNSFENDWVVSNFNGNKTATFLDVVEFSKSLNNNYFIGNITVEETGENEVATNVKLNSNGVKYFSTVSLIHGNGTVSQNVPQRIFSAGLNHQAWFWSPEQDVVDVVIKRSDSSISSYSNVIDFDIVYGGETISAISLPSDLDYGFARFKKYPSGIWYLEPSYTINMLYNTTQYASNTTITSNENFSNTILEIFDNVTLSIEATLNLDDVDVKLGKDAKIRVMNGGKLIANNGSKFKRLDPAKEHDGVWLETANNEINNSTIQGGYMGLRINGADNLVINQSTIEDNFFGIYAINSDNVHIYGSEIKDNNNDGIFAYYSDIYIDPNTTTNQLHSLFQNNGDNAISSGLNSNIHVYNSEFLDNYKHALYLDQGSRIYLGATSSDGNNIFDDAGATRKHIWSYALTGSGETATQWTVPARSNYWDDGDEPSSSNDFFGSVDYSNYLSTPPGSAAKIVAFNSVVSAQSAQKLVEEGFSNKQVDNSIELKQFIQEIKDQIDNSDYDRRIGKWIRNYAGMIDVADKKLLKEEAKYLLKLKKKWLSRYQFVNNMTISDSLNGDISASDKEDLQQTPNDPETVQRISAVQTVGEVMLALEMKEALDNDNYARIFTLVTEYDGRVRSYDLKHELISYMVVASIETQRYTLALKLIERLEGMYPEQDLQDDGWEPEDFTVLKADIESLKAKGKSYSDDDQLAKAFESELYLGSEIDENEAVTEFKLYPAYPNPFNPSTIVSFDLPQQGKVRVDVYDISGRLVSVLANQTYQPGNHRLTFEASGLASGIYFVRANIAGNLQSQRITLIK